MNETVETDQAPAWVRRQQRQNTQIVAVLFAAAGIIVTIFTLFG